MDKELLMEMQKPEFYPEKERSNVTVIQTHISFIFLLDRYAYKVKKPVDFGFLDFTTLEKRKFFCERELHLNRRLAQDIYLELVSISKLETGYSFSNKNPIEYAVKMLRLPEENMLHKKIKKGVSEKEMIEIGKTLAKFHKRAENSEEIDRYGSVEMIKKNTDENFFQTEKYINKTISKEKFEFSRKTIDEFYTKFASLLRKRVKDKKIRDGHGDVRMEHICLYNNKIYIFDCIEFVDRFRYGDVLSDMAFLSMELDFEKYKREKKYYEKGYFEEMGENIDEIKPLYLFYLSYRAYVRGKVTSFLLDDPYLKDKEKEYARKRAEKLFTLSTSYLQELRNYYFF